MVIDLYCDCGELSDVKTAENGRLNHAWARPRDTKCPFFMFIEPEMHYVARQLKASTRVFESIKMEVDGSDAGGNMKAD